MKRSGAKHKLPLTVVMEPVVLRSGDGTSVTTGYLVHSHLLGTIPLLATQVEDGVPYHIERSGTPFVAITPFGVS